jgi:hypothetical protein
MNVERADDFFEDLTTVGFAEESATLRCSKPSQATPSGRHSRESAYDSLS